MANTQSLEPTQSNTEFFAMVRDMVGGEHLKTTAEDVERLAQVIIPVSQLPLGYVYPGSRDELIALVKLAAQHRVPLWPCGKGKNWGYGSATPAEAGGLIVVLERLNRIVEVNEEMAYAVIEPGVTYRQLHQYLVDQKLDLWTDATDGPADGSVIGNALERGVGETPYGDHFGNLCGLEVVLADGTVVQTGGGEHDRCKSRHTHKWGVGPYIEGLFSQCNLGIVIQAGIWLMPKPPRFESCLFQLKNEKDLPRMVDALRLLTFEGAIQSKVHAFNEVVSLAVAAGEVSRQHGAAALSSDEQRAEMRRKYSLPPWSFAAGVYGTPAQLRAAKALIRRRLKPLGQVVFLNDGKIRFIERLVGVVKGERGGALERRAARFFLDSVVRVPVAFIETIPHVHRIEQGQPSDYFVKHAYFKSPVSKPPDHDINPARDKCGVIWIAPVVPLHGAELNNLLDVVRPLFESYNFDFYVCLILEHARSVIVLLSVFYDRTNPEETRRAREFYYELGHLTQKHGYQQYRTSTMFMPHIFNASPAFKEMITRIKRALDPQGILAPGKYGISIDD